MSAPSDEMRLRALLDETNARCAKVIVERDRLRGEVADLLAALQEVIRVFDGCPKSIVDTVWVTHLPSITLYDFCQTVITKIKGETS